MKPLGIVHEQPVNAQLLKRHHVIFSVLGLDMELEARASFTGPFPSAVRALFEGLYAQGSPFTARLYHGNRILKVEDR